MKQLFKENFTIEQIRDIIGGWDNELNCVIKFRN